MAQWANPVTEIRGCLVGPESAAAAAAIDVPAAPLGVTAPRLTAECRAGNSCRSAPPQQHHSGVTAVRTISMRTRSTKNITTLRNHRGREATQSISFQDFQDKVASPGSSSGVVRARCEVMLATGVRQLVFTRKTVEVVSTRCKCLLYRCVLRHVVSRQWKHGGTGVSTLDLSRVC